MIKVAIPKYGDRVVALGELTLHEKVRVGPYSKSKDRTEVIKHGQKFTVIGSLRAIHATGFISLRVDDEDRTITFGDDARRSNIDIPVDLFNLGFAIIEKGDKLEDLPHVIIQKQQPAQPQNVSRWKDMAEL